MSEFKSAQPSKSVASAPAPEPKNPDRVHTIDEEVPIALHEEIKGIPYTANFFEVSEIWDDSDIDMKDDILSIEDAYREKVSSGELQDGEQSFKSFIKEAVKVTNTRNSPSTVKIAKIAAWVSFMSNLADIDRNRKRYAR